MAGLVDDLLIQIRGDSSSAQKAIKDVENKTTNFGSFMKKHAAEIKSAAAVTATVVAGLAVYSAKQYMEAEKILVRLTNTLKHVGVTGRESRDRLTDLARSMQAVSGIADDTILDAMNDLLRITRDYDTVLEHTSTLMDFAAGESLDLGTAADLLGKAYNGQTSMLKRYGIFLKDGITGTEALAEISKRYMGDSAVQAETLSKKFTGTKSALDDLGESSGEVLKPILVEILDLIKDAAEYWDRFVSKFKKEEVSKNVKKEMEKLEELRKLYRQSVSSQVTAGLAKDKNSFSEDSPMRKQIEAYELAQKGYMDNIKAQIKYIAQLKETEKAEAEAANKKDKTNTGGGTDNPTPGGNDDITKLDAYTEHLNMLNEMFDAYSSKVEQATLMSDTFANTFETLGKSIAEDEIHLSKALAAAGKATLITLIDYYEQQVKVWMAIQAMKVASGDVTAVGGLVAGGVAITAIEVAKAKIAAMAEGGLVTKPTLALVGEAGPEMVIPLKKAPQVINSMQTAGGKAAGMAGGGTYVFNQNGPIYGTPDDKFIKNVSQRLGELTKSGTIQPGTVTGEN